MSTAIEREYLPLAVEAINLALACTMDFRARGHAHGALGALADSGILRRRAVDADRALERARDTLAELDPTGESCKLAYERLCRASDAVRKLYL